MSLSADLASIRQHIEAFKSSAEQELAEHLPGAEAVAAKIESDPLVQAALSTVLPDGWKQIAADFITKLEGLAQEAEQDKQAAAAQAVADAQAAAAAPPAEPDTPADPSVASAA
jgi:hypothetical protein